MKTRLAKTILAVTLCLTLGLNNTLFATADADLFANPAAPEWIIDAPISDELNKGFQDGTEDVSSGDANAIHETGNAEDLDVSGSDVSSGDLTVSGSDMPAFTGEYTDDQVAISVNAAAGVLPLGVELSVTPIVKQEVQNNMSDEEKAEQEAVNALYDDTEAHLEADTADEEELQAFLAYDISFLKDGKEIEPAGYVDVVMEFVGAVLPEGVTEDAEIAVSHLAKDDNSNTGITVEDITASADIQTAGDGLAVEKVVLTSDSFSTFVIRWNNKSDRKITVKYVDESGKEISGPKSGTIDVDNKEWVNLEDSFGDAFTSNGITYKYKEARMNEVTGTQIKQIRYNSSTCYYRTGDSGDGLKWGNSQKVVLLVFKANAQLPTIETADSKSKGITIQMFDYTNDRSYIDKLLGDNKSDVYNQYKAPAKLGNVQNLLDSSSKLPVSVAHKAVLKDLFSVNNNSNYRGEANHLLQYDEETGYYSYSCFENYAYWDRSELMSDGTYWFKVYDALGTPISNNNFFYKRGNFFPFNNISAGQTSDYRNVINSTGGNLSKDDPRYNDPLYLTLNASGQPAANTQFGMTLEATFYQPKAGKVNGDNMVYRFNGDDDLWIFIDDVLVLDIGGVHDARQGYIDFATGEVYVDLVRKSSSDNAGVEYRTTIKESFKAAGKNTSTGFTGNTFSDYSSHTIRMFYMEHGAGASNLQMEFNLPTIPSDEVQVVKQVTEANMADFTNADFEFEMQLGDEGALKDYNGTYKLVDISTDPATVLDEAVPVVNGKFTLKHNQKAVFSNIKMNQYWKVTELGVNSSEYDGVRIESTNMVIVDDEGNKEESRDVTTGEIPVANNRYVLFQNKCNSENNRNLVIQKELIGPTDITSEYTMFVEYKKGLNWVPYEGNYYLNDTTGNAKITNNGEVTLKAGEQAIIQGFISGTEVRVREIGLNDAVYENPQYTSDNLAEVDNTDGIAGKITINYPSNPIITVTNQKVGLDSRLSKSKTVKLLDWDERTYQIDLEATAKKISSTTKVKRDVILVVDMSGSMGYDVSSEHIIDSFEDMDILEKGVLYKAYISGVDYLLQYRNNQWMKAINKVEYVDGKGVYDWSSFTQSDVTGKQFYVVDCRMSVFQKALKGFINSIGSDCKLAIIAFTDRGEIILNATNMNAEGKSEALENLYSILPQYGTFLDTGLQYVNGLKAGMKDAAVVVFTDGDNNSEYNAKGKAADRAAEIKADGTPVFTIGIQGDGEEFLRTQIATKEGDSGFDSKLKYHQTTDGSLTGLDEIFGSIVEDIGGNMVGTIVDVIDQRFELVTGEKERLEKAGATVTVNKTDGTTTITWNSASIGTTAPGWSASIQIRAKDEYIGGNDVPTNGPESGITIPELGESAFDRPTVNVKVKFNVGEAEDTIFLGEDLTDYFTNVQQDKITAPRSAFNSDVEISMIQDVRYEVEWYGDKSCTERITADNIRKAMLSEETAYYAKVTAFPLNKGTDVTGDMKGDGNGQIQHNSGQMIYAVPVEGVSSDNLGTYTVHIVSGSIAITKELTKQFNSALEGDPIFTFKIEYRKTESGEVEKTLYRTVKFTSDVILSADAELLTGLPKGYYTVSELTTQKYKQNGVATDETTTCKYMEGEDSLIFVLGMDQKNENSKEARFGKAIFTNEKKGSSTNTDSDVRLNRFVYKEDEGWVIESYTVPNDPQNPDDTTQNN